MAGSQSCHKGNSSSHLSGIYPAAADSEIRVKGSPDLNEQAEAFEGFSVAPAFWEQGLVPEGFKAVFVTWHQLCGRMPFSSRLDVLNSLSTGGGTESGEQRDLFCSGKNKADMIQ